MKEIVQSVTYGTIGIIRYGKLEHDKFKEIDF